MYHLVLWFVDFCAHYLARLGDHFAPSFVQDFEVLYDCYILVPHEVVLELLVALLRESLPDVFVDCVACSKFCVACCCVVCIFSSIAPLGKNNLFWVILVWLSVG